MLSSITIQGDGVAACCCARLLSNRGLNISFQRTTRPSLPSLLVSPSIQSLIADVFNDRQIFADFPVIRKRMVLWRNKAFPLRCRIQALLSPSLFSCSDCGAG